MLAAFNITYNNGGGGIHVFGSSNVTVANNSCFNNYLDPANGGAARACIDDNGGSANTFINNIALAIPASVANCRYHVVPYTQWNSAVIGSPKSREVTDTFSNNITRSLPGSCSAEYGMYNGDTYPVPPNLQNTSTGWVDVGNTSVGTEITPPVGSNFALAPGSPAIGAGLTEPYLPASSVDIGACASALTRCP
jgi:parallel beta-helix repeat protein